MFFWSKLRRGPLLVLGGGLALASVQAQVVITGSSLRQIEASGALPVQTLTRADIERTGVQTTEQLLRVIPAMSTSGQTQSATAVGLSTWGAADVSLRGLGGERTLVLVNGQRLAAFAGGGGANINVNNIPLAAIERVEVLKDGASAVYGSDAVAGVVNFILRQDFRGVQASATYGTPTARGGGQQYQASLVGGIGDLGRDRFNLTGSAQWGRNRDLFGIDRAYARSSDRLPYFFSGATASGEIQGAWDLNAGAPDRMNGVTVPLADPALPPGSAAAYVRGSPFYGYGNPLAAADRCGDNRMTASPFPTFTTVRMNPPPAEPDALELPLCVYDTGPMVGLLTRTESVSTTLNGAWQLHERAQLYGDLLWSRTQSTQTYQQSPLRTDFMESDEEFLRQGVDPVLLVRRTNPAHAVAADYLNAVGLGELADYDLGVTSRVMDFGLRSNVDTSTQTRIVTGLRGQLADHDYDLAAYWSQSRLSGRTRDGYFSQLAYAQATQDPASDWNPWAATQSQAFQDAVAAAKYVGPTLRGTSSSYGVQATLSGELAALPAGALRYAAGAQYRDESLRTDPAPALLSGDIAGLGGATKAIDVGRSVFALFGELNLPVARSLDFNAALRWDDYRDFGATTNWKASLRWQPLPQLMLRGSYGTGFRAPTLTDLHSPVVLGASAEFDDPLTGRSNLQVNEWSGGNPQLQPETSSQFALGFVLQPTRSFAFGVDYFDVEVKDVIAQPSTQEVVAQAAAGNPAFAPLVVRDPVSNEIVSTRTQLLNSGRIRVAGLDLSANYRERFGAGTLQLGVQGTYYTRYDQTSAAGATTSKIATTVDGDGNPVPSSVVGLDGYGVVLRYRQYASATWRQGNWATTLANSFASGYQAGWDVYGNPTRVGAMSLWDLMLAYTGWRNAVLTLGARNLFDKQPGTFVNVSNAFQSGYDPSQYDPRGRFVFVTGSWRF